MDWRHQKGHLSSHSLRPMNKKVTMCRATSSQCITSWICRRDLWQAWAKRSVACSVRTAMFLYRRRHRDVSSKSWQRCMLPKGVGGLPPLGWRHETVWSRLYTCTVRSVGALNIQINAKQLQWGNHIDFNTDQANGPTMRENANQCFGITSKGLAFLQFVNSLMHRWIEKVGGDKGLLTEQRMWAEEGETLYGKVSALWPLWIPCKHIGRN